MTFQEHESFEGSGAEVQGRMMEYPANAEGSSSYKPKVWLQSHFPKNHLVTRGQFHHPLHYFEISHYSWNDLFPPIPDGFITSRWSLE